jgi:SNF2 family DNA or RNA helicase
MNAKIKVQMEKNERVKEEWKRRVHDSTNTDTLQLLHVNYESSSSNNNHGDNIDESDGDSSIETNMDIRRSRKIRYSQIHSSDDDDRSVTYKEYISNHSGSSSSSSISSENDNQDDEDLAIIGTILARKKDTIRNWNKICKDMNTCEIERGSIWHDPSRNPVENELDREETRYLVRWTNCSYIHCSWEIELDLLEQTSNGEYQLRAFNQQFRESGLRYDVIERNQGAYFDPNYTKIDRILDIQDSQVKNLVFDPSHKDYADGTGRQFLIKWKNTPYGDSTYEHERDLINRKVEFESHVKSYLQRIQRPTPQQIKENRIHQERQTRSLYKVLGDSVHPTNDKSEKIADYVKELEKVSYPDGRKLRGYQAEGLAWLIGNYINRRSSILADEMGLGKTISTAAFLQTLFTNFHNRGPFLVIAPLSTLPQWYREMSSWTDLNVIMYTGNSLDKAIIHEFEFPFHSDRPTGLRKNQRYLKNCHRNSLFKKVWMPQIVITSPESFTGKDTCELIDVEWEMLVFDEAHARLKNDQSKLSLALRDEKFLFKHLLLLTGTPIQNNMSELWSILNVIDTTKFGDRDYFIDRYGNMRNKDQVEELHTLLRPYILRRLKEDVEKNLPPKEETIIEVELTVLQKQYYRALFERNIGFLSRGDKGGKRFNNVCMQLRKCCNHPYLLDGVEELVNENQNQETETSNVESLIKASGKLVLLDKLLPKLKEGGHRVLIFSQFKIMLDIIEDYLSHRNFGYERIDGDVTGFHRQQAIDRFQAPESSSFIMMLSTKAGGVGINLTSADTCILFDSDWNPQNDLQAQARCHRIGQTKSVKIYRLLCRKSYEMRLFQLASMKMGLDKVVMNGVENGYVSSFC